MDQIDLPEEETINRGDYEEVYKDSTVRVIQPLNEAASCFWGKGTRWCTAATSGNNYFDTYNRDGPIYILLPTKPLHNGEKYQFHFQSMQFMDEKDEPILNLRRLMISRFPDLLAWFKTNSDTTKIVNSMIAFASNEIINKLVADIRDISQDIVMKYYTELETDDEEYPIWLRDNGYVDSEGDIDWENAPPNPQLQEWLNEINDLLDPSPDDVREISNIMVTEGNEDCGDMAFIEVVIAYMVGSKGLSYSRQISNWIRFHVQTIKTDDTYTVIKSN
jgi:hypothetical protein